MLEIIDSPILENHSIATIALQWVQDHSPITIVGRTLYRYELNGTWRPMTEVEIKSSIQDMNAQYRVATKGGRIKDLELSPQFRNQVYDFVLHHSTIQDPYFFRQAPIGVAVRNGFLKVSATAVDLVPHSPNNRAVIALDVAYNAKEGCPKFLNLLEKVLPNQAHEQALIQDFYGTALLGLSTEYQRCLLLLGSGANGKSTLMETIEEALFDVTERGKISPDRWDHEYYIMELFGKKINSIPELPTGEMLASEKFKAVVAGDEVVGRRPTEKPSVFRPTAAHVFAVNELPDTGDVTDGFWRRFLIVPLVQKFTGSDSKDTIKRDILSSERAGILLWAIEGAQRVLQRGGFSLPPSHESTKVEWQTHADPVRGFLEACCEVQSDVTSSMGAIYDSYKEWCRLTNRKASRNSVLGRRLKNVAGITSRHTNTGSVYNIRVKHPSEWRDVRADYYRATTVDLSRSSEPAKPD